MVERESTTYLPEKVKPFDPVIAESSKNREPQIIEKAQEIILAAGVIQLPVGRDGPTALIMEGDTIVQAFSSSGDTVFRTVSEIVGKRNEFIRAHIGNEDFKIFYIVATTGDNEPVFLKLHNPVKAAVYQRLLTEQPNEGERYSAAEFQRDEFVKASPEEVATLLEKYLTSIPRSDLADHHYLQLTQPATRTAPGGGEVQRLYATPVIQTENPEEIARQRLKAILEDLNLGAGDSSLTNTISPEVTSQPRNNWLRRIFRIILGGK